MGDPTARDAEWERPAPGLGDADPAPPSARRALPPLAPPLDRGVQPVVAAGIFVGLLVLLWLRKKFVNRSR